MRPELEKIKYIEDFIKGELPQDEEINFINEINNNPELAKEVEIQRQLIKRSERLAFKEQLDALHDKHFAGSNKKWWQKNIWLNSLLALLVTGLLIAGLMFTFSDNEVDTSLSISTIPEIEVQDSIPEVEEQIVKDSVQPRMIESAIETIDDTSSVEEETTKDLVEIFEPENLADDFVNNVHSVDNIPELKIENFLPVFDTLNYNPAKGLVHEYERSGTVLNLPKNLIAGKEGLNENIQILYREYRNQAEIAFSGIPMHYEENDSNFEFESGGMFEFKPIDSTLKMNLDVRKEVEMDFALTNTSIDLDYYELVNGKWQKKAIILERKSKQKQLRLNCQEDKICKFEVWGGMGPELQEEYNRRNPIDQRVIHPGYLDYGFYKLGQYIKKRRAKRRGEAEKVINKDVYGDMEFSVLIPNKSLKKKITVNVHYDEAMVYRNEAIRCYEARELLFSILDKNCNTCRHDMYLADSMNLAQLEKPLFNLDSLKKEISKRSDYKSDQQKMKIINEFFNEKELLPEYYLSDNRKFVNIRGYGFGIANCDRLRNLSSDSPYILSNHFFNKKGELIKDVAKVSVVPLDFCSASSYQVRSVIIDQLAFRTLFIFSKSGLYYLDNKKLRGLVLEGGARNNMPEKLSNEINTAEKLMEFINSERNRLIEN